MERRGEKSEREGWERERELEVKTPYVKIMSRGWSIYELWMWGIGGMIVTGGNGISRRKTVASVTFPTTDTTWTGLGQNLFLRREMAPQLSFWFFAPYIVIKLCNIIYLFTAIRLSPGGSGYFTCKQNMKLVTNKFKSEGLHEKQVVATWNLGNRLIICL